MKVGRIKEGDVWHTARTYRRVLTLGYSSPSHRPVVAYENRYGTYRNCLLKTFRRWVSKNGARRAQRRRGRDLRLKG